MTAPQNSSVPGREGGCRSRVAAGGLPHVRSTRIAPPDAVWDLVVERTLWPSIPALSEAFEVRRLGCGAFKVECRHCQHGFLADAMPENAVPNIPHSKRCLVGRFIEKWPCSLSGGQPAEEQRQRFADEAWSMACRIKTAEQQRRYRANRMLRRIEAEIVREERRKRFASQGGIS